jgi:hypothetical protein
LILKTITAILNSLVNIKIRHLLPEADDMDTLNDCFRLIEELKGILASLGLAYDKHTTYIGTEIELKYFLALFYKNTHQIPKARAEITAASNMLTELKKLPDYEFTSDFFKNRFSKIAPLMNELMQRK